MSLTNNVFCPPFPDCNSPGAMVDACLHVLGSGVCADAGGVDSLLCHKWVCDVQSHSKEDHREHSEVGHVI